MAPLVMERGVSGTKMWGTQLVMLQDPLPAKCDDADTICGPLHFWWAGVVCLVQWACLTWRQTLFEVEVRGVEWNLNPYVKHLVLATVPAEGWTIDLYKYGLLYGPSDGMHLPNHYGEIFKFGMMTWGSGMVINLAFPQRFLQIPYVLITLQPITFVPV